MDPISPRNAAKLAVADALGALSDDLGLTLVQLATAWAATHPAVSSVVIGPRTVDQLEGSLAAADVTLTPDALDRIDAIVSPGVTLDVVDTMWAHGTRALDTSQRRLNSATDELGRRYVDNRAAGRGVYLDDRSSIRIRACYCNRNRFCGSAADHGGFLVRPFLPAGRSPTTRPRAHGPPAITGPY